MATKDDILEALVDYQVQCNENKRLRRMQKALLKLLNRFCQTREYSNQKLIFKALG